ncbi:hypothetical protein B0H11DRAFT_711129 [Mycena galericulata]|nr:hypothetical protein B0H11DRAFT_711129 [Mycena galericulata]
MSDPTALPPAITRAFVLTWGVEFVAYTLDTTLWGMGILLVLQYFRKYANKDPSSIQLVVAILGTFSTIHVIFLAIMNYKDFVSLFGNMEAQNLILHEANVMLCSVFVVSFTAQMFYASRIWYLANRNWKLLAPVILLGVIQFAAGIAQTVLVAQVKFYSKLQVTTAPVSSTQAGASLACDVTITVILFITLRKSRTGIRRTDSALDKMTIYALNRGAMTSLWALLHLIFFVGMPGTFVFMLSVVPSCHRKRVQTLVCLS